MYNIVIVDDETIWREDIHQGIERILNRSGINDARVHSYSSGAPLLTGLRLGDDVNLVFLDVQLGREISGLDLAQKVRELAPDTRIVLVSSNSDYVFEGYDVQATYFFDKPINEEKLELVLTRDYYRYHLQSTILLKLTNGLQTILLLKDILYFEHYYGQTRIVLEDEEYMTKKRLAELIEELLSADFLSCHKSYIVNLKKVVAVERYHFTLYEDSRVPISKLNYLEIRDQYEDYLTTQIQSGMI